MITIVLSFLTAFILTLIPLPAEAEAYRPDWVAMVLIYWCLALPHRVGPGTGWFVGLLLDVTRAELLGIHAFGLVVTAFLTNRLHLRMRMYPWWQQAASVLLLLLLYRGIVGWLRSLVTAVQFDYQYWLPCIIAMVVWPWLFVILRDLRRKAKIS